MSAIYKTLTGTNETDRSEHKYKNRQRVLLIMSRGVTSRHRHLISDIHAMLPHAHKEPKYDGKEKLSLLNEIAGMYNCNNILYFEARKHLDLYMWMSKAPNGPTAKFHVQNIHTMDELNFTGNCLKGSRPILSFDVSFNESAHYRLIKEMFIQIMGVPPRARKSKPFIDHVVSFGIVDNKIWVRNYQILEEQSVDGKQLNLSLVEIGPRYVLTLISVLEGSFGGPVIYENKEYVSPNAVRAQQRKVDAIRSQGRDAAKSTKAIRKRDHILKADPLDPRALFRETSA